MAEEHNLSYTGHRSIGFVGRGCSSTEQEEVGRVAGLGHQRTEAGWRFATCVAKFAWQRAAANLQQVVAGFQEAL
jgi:hypothetical protein